MKKEESGIKKWAKDDQPREKMTKKGPLALSDAELIAILIHSGTKENSAVDLAREILKMGNDNLVELGKIASGDLQKLKGIGEARAITLMAALELGRRRQLSAGMAQKKLNNSKEAAEILMPLMRDLAREHFCVLFLAVSNKLIHYEFVSAGGLTSTTVDLKVIFKTALQHLAARIIVAHNHPSGNPRPSNADKQITQKLVAGGKALDIQLMDHIIITDHRYFSFADEGLL